MQYWKFYIVLFLLYSKLKLLLERKTLNKVNPKVVAPLLASLCYKTSDVYTSVQWWCGKWIFISGDDSSHNSAVIQHKAEGSISMLHVILIILHAFLPFFSTFILKCLVLTLIDNSNKTERNCVTKPLLNIMSQLQWLYFDILSPVKL